MNVKAKGRVKYLEIIGVVLRKLLGSGERVLGKLLEKVLKAIKQ